MKWITAGDLKNWVTSERRHCEQTLPELIQRLILETASGVSRITFPSGDSVTTAGWDGNLETRSVSPFFPRGISGWEIGVEPSPEKKADKDYAGRSRKPLGLVKKESTFVFVTPRPFPKRTEWEARKRRGKVWADVRVIAADELVTWLDSRPSVALWLARQLKKTPTGVRDLGAAWDEWSNATDPAMIPDVVRAGRDGAVEGLHRWLAGPPGILEVQGDSPDEALAFLYAAIYRLDEPLRLAALSRCLVVDTLDQMRGCLEFERLILAAPAHCRQAAGYAVTKGHHVFLIADSNTIDHGGRLVQLSRPRTEALAGALRKNGLSDDDAYRRARDSGASIPVLRRLIFRASSGRPEWTRPEWLETLIPAMLAGAWVSDRDGDRAVLEALSGCPFQEFISALERLLKVEDSPVRRVDQVWMIKSPLDAWFMLAQYVDQQHAARFQEVATAVLRETDPKYDLEPDQRWAAAIYGKQSRHSEWVQQGLVKSLVMLGVQGHRTHDRNGSVFADATTTDILRHAEGWQAWSSLRRITPLLAEAAPEAFLRVLEEQLRSTPSTFVELLRDDGSVFGECQHAGLLWALESLAWDPRLLSRAAHALAALAAIDPGGKWSNRPAASLRDIFLPGLPQTYASPGMRLQVLDGLTAESPELVWGIIEGVVAGGMISAAHQFTWRSYSDQRSPLEQESPEWHREYVNGLVPRLKGIIADHPTLLISAVRDFVRLEVAQEAILQALTTLDPAVLSTEERDRLVKNLREVLHWVNRNGNEKQREYSVDLTKAMELLMPLDPLLRYGWLLGEAWPRLPEGDPDDFSKSDDLILRRRQEAAREVLDQDPLDKIVEYGGSVRYPGVFGHAFAKIVRDDLEDAAFMDAIVGAPTLNEGLLVGYALGRVEARAPGWIDSEVQRLHASGRDRPQVVAGLYLGLPENRTTWNRVATYGPDVEKAYWRKARGRSGAASDSDAEIAVAKLLEVGRASVALSLAGAPGVSLPSTALQRLLQTLLAPDFDPKDVDGGMFQFYLENVFKQLDDHNELAPSEIANLEWPFAQILADDIGRHTNRPLAIHKVLQSDPSLFAMLVALIYKRDDGSIQESTSDLTERQKRNVRDNADQVLRTWRLLPGLLTDGSIDAETLLKWVDRARTQCAQTGHSQGCDLQLARVLARSPVDSDGLWPHRAVREVVEKLQNPLIDRHIPIAVSNNRGVVTRAIDEGGEQERMLAKRYQEMGDALAGRWPRTIQSRSRTTKQPVVKTR